MFKKSFYLVLLVTLFGAALWAQNSDRPVRPTRNDAPTRVPPAASTAAARTRVSAPTASSGSLSAYGNQAAGAAVGSPAGYGSIPVQTYGNGVDISTGGWYRCNYFVEQLMRDYRFVHGYDYLWRYAQGDSPLTPEALALALRSSSSASRQLNLLADHLNHLIASYERGEIEQTAFNREVRTTTHQIRDWAKRIRKDYYLGYLDTGSDVDVPDYDEPTSLSELKGLAGQLRETAHGIDGTLEGFLHRDLSRVVSVKDLQSPSTDSMSKQIDHLAKAIEKSGPRL